MTCPFTTKPPWLRDEDLVRRCPFPEQPPSIKSKARFLDDEIVWSLFLKQLGGSEEEDAATIDAFAKRLGVDRSRIINKLKAHVHNDNETLH
jgi:hypothetical protein